MIETISYIEESNITKVFSDIESITFVDDISMPYLEMPFIGIESSIPFLNSKQVRFKILRYKLNDLEVSFSPSFTNGVLTGLTGNNGFMITIKYINGLVSEVIEIRNNDRYNYYLTRDTEGKLFEINSFLNDNLISQKEIIYSENDIVIGFNEYNTNKMFSFDSFDVVSFETHHGSFTVQY
jgi:hypothetical protein